MAEKLTQQQQAAVENRGGPLLVSAAAGSGKTKVLVDRLLSYLTDPVNPANVDDFLIITYTKAAAAELRGKIAQKLSQRIAEEPQNRHLQQQMQRLYLAKISTVHSFCSDILRENAYRLDISADFRVADENECVQLQMQALEQVLNEAYETIDSNSNLCRLINTQGFGRDDRSVPQIVLKVYHSAMCHLDPDKWLDWCEYQSRAEGIEDAAQTVWGKYLVSDLQKFLDMNILALSNCAALAGANDTMEKPHLLLVNTVQQLKSLRACYTWDQIVGHPAVDFGRLTFSKKCTDLQLADQIKAIRDACKTGLVAKLRSFRDCSDVVLSDLRATGDSTAGLVYLVRMFAKQYEQIKRIRRILDFADLEHRMLDLLLGKKRTGITSAAGEIGERFREIMVDEYQDSNGVQDAIFGALTAKRKNCFMVGDVKQSIYQFRLADPGIFIEKYETFLPAAEASDGQGRKILLSKNFRSSGGVISAVNDVFSQCMSVNVGGLDYTADEMLYEGIPHVKLDEPEVELYTIDVQEDTYEEESNFVADRISVLLDGNHMVRDGESLRPIVPSDIAILLRSPGSVGGHFQYALQSRGIKCCNGDSTDLLQTEEVMTLVSILQIIVNPQQDIPLLAALSSRVFSFTADELACIRGKNKYCSIYDALRADSSDKVKEFLSLLHELRVLAQRVKVTRLIEEIFLKTGLLNTYFATADGEIRCANLKAFLQVAADFAGGGQKDLIQFLDFLQSMEDRGLVIANEQDMDSVTIMSIHKSKGLEFPVVFLCGLSRGFNMESAREQVLCHKELGLGLNFVDTGNRVRYPTIAKRAISAKVIEDGISEEMRVLYVAMTRPKDRLIMTYARRNLASDIHDTVMRMGMSPKELMTGQVSCPGDWVMQTALTKTEAGELFAIGGNPVCAQVSEIPWLISASQTQCSASVEMDEVIDTACVPEEWLRQMKESLPFRYCHNSATNIPSKQTATQLKGRVKDHEVSQDTRQSIAPSFRRPSFIRPKTAPTDYGVAMHAFMQHTNYSRCLTEAGVCDEIKRLVDAQLLTVEQAEMISPVQIVNFFSTELGKALMQQENVLREFKFSILVDADMYYPDVVDEQILLQGVIDCAIIEDDGICVIDFKTDHVTKDTVSEAAERYRHQVEAYKHALQRIYGLPVKEAYLYFFRISQFVKV